VDHDPHECGYNPDAAAKPTPPRTTPNPDTTVTNHAPPAQQLAERAHYYSYGDGADSVTGTALATEGTIHALLAIATELRDLRGDLAIDHESRERVLKHAGQRLRSGAAGITPADDYRRGLRHGYYEAANALLYGLAVQPRDRFWAEGPVSVGRPVAEPESHAADHCKDCGTPRANGQFLHANHCLPG
jgi:hypothetical protein